MMLFEDLSTCYDEGESLEPFQAVQYGETLAHVHAYYCSISCHRSMFYIKLSTISTFKMKIIITIFTRMFKFFENEKSERRTMNKKWQKCLLDVDS